jgi:hypothetical protein
MEWPALIGQADQHALPEEVHELNPRRQDSPARRNDLVVSGHEAVDTSCGPYVRMTTAL